MCTAALVPALAGLSQAGTAAAGLANIGTAISVAGSLATGLQAASVQRENAEMATRQAAIEQQLAAVEDQEVRARMADEMARQRLSLGARGISLASPTALVLGRAAATEIAKASQKVRSQGAVRAEELTAEARNYRANARLSLLRGTFSAGGALLTRANDIWPTLKTEGLAK